MKRRDALKHPTVAIAARVAELDSKVPGKIRLIAAGPFRTRDGRPGNVPAWRMDAAIAARA